MRWCLLVLATVMIGCSHQPSPETTSTSSPSEEVPIDPEAKSFEQWKTGTYQINASLDSIQVARDSSFEMSKKAGGSAADALSNVTDQLDDAASAISEYSEGPKSKEDLHKNFASYDDQRLQAIQACIGALETLDEVDETITELQKTAPKQYQQTLQEISDSVSEANDALSEAVTGFGGKLPPDEAPDKQPK